MGLQGYFPYGMGDLSPTQISSPIISVGSAAASIAGFGAIAGPIGAIAGVLVGLFTQLFSGCGQSCTLTSQEANQIVAQLQQNLAAWNASQKTQSEQTAALANFDYAWSQLEQFCGQPSMGSAGQRCISERERGGVSNWCCKATPCSSMTPAQAQFASCSVPSSQSCNAGPPCCSGCDMFKTLRDPIALDPAVIEDESATLPIGSTVGASGTVAGVSTTGTVSIGSLSIPTSLLLLGGAAVLAVVVLS
jgi:hypothetical protein